MGLGPTRGFEPEQMIVFSWKQLRGGVPLIWGPRTNWEEEKKTHLEEGYRDAEKEGTKAVMMNVWKEGDARSCEMTVFWISATPSPGRAETPSACS